MLKFGKPDAVYVDNGKEFVSKWMRIGCSRLGIRHLRTAPYSAESKGKVERFQLTVEEFIREASLVKIKDLAHLNSLYRPWLEEGYQHKEHEGIGKISPMSAFQKDGKRIRFATPEECYDAFLHEDTRTVDKTGCFSLNGVTFEASVAFIRKKVDVRFDPFDMSVVEVWHGGEKKLDAIPIAIGEFTNTPRTKTKKTATEVGRSRLLDIYAKENEKRLKNATGILRFDSQGGNPNV